MARMLGRYELLRPLARGGMAELFLARRRAPGGVDKRMVIKRIRRERARDARFAALFVREARLSMSLAHKNIVPVFDFGRAGDELFLVMEYVDGVDLAMALARAVERGAPADPLVVAFIGLEACQALEYAQEVAGRDGQPQGVIHRDVTPSNVILSYSGEVKLLDFGIATTETEVGEATRVRGTPPYMAPEQARGEAVSARTDVFALGLVLWEALAGRRAHGGKDASEILAAAREGEVAPLDPERAPPALRAIIERATRADPVDRFADARAMQESLDEYLIDARAGHERRGPAHQLLAAWVRELFPERAAASGAPIAGLDGPVATFLDDGEERVTEFVRTPGSGGSTARSMATTSPEPAAAEPDVAGQSPDGGAQRSSAPSRRAARVGSRRWLLAAGIILAGGTGAVLVGGKLAGRPRPAPAGRPLSTGGEHVSSEAAAPPGEATAPRPVAPESVAGGEPDGGPVEGPSRLAAPSSPPATRRVPAREPRRGAGRSGRGATATGGAPPSGTVRVSTTPWAAVRVMGRPERCRETPCTLVLPAGSYVLALRNPVAGVGKNVAVEVLADETVTLRETLTAPR